VARLAAKRRAYRHAPATVDGADLCLDAGALPPTPRAVQLLAELLCRVAERQRAAADSPAPAAAAAARRKAVPR
jgi:hypothetical protein